MRTLPPLGRSDGRPARVATAGLVGLASAFALVTAVDGEPTRTTQPSLRLVDSAVVESPDDAPDDARGPHAITRVEVDNDGPRVRVRAEHEGSRWRGTVAVELRVPGEGRTRVARRGTTYVAEVRHAPGQRTTTTSYPTARPARTQPWGCFGARVRSKPNARTTVVDVPRACLDGAERVAVRVVATTATGLESVRRTKLVAQQSRPNILFFMVDDMRADEIQWMPRTRALIGDEGVTFENAFSTYPLCCPARASVLTGQYAHNHGVLGNKRPYGTFALDDDATIATSLQEAGYRTNFIGKYLNGYGSTQEEGGKGWIYYRPPGWTQWRASLTGGLPREHPKAGGSYRFFDTTLSVNGRRLDNYQGRYQTRVYGQLAAQQIRRDADKADPFFTWVSFAAPHVGFPREPDDPQAVVREDGSLAYFPTAVRPGDVKGMFDDLIVAGPGSDWEDPDRSDQAPELQSIQPLSDAEREALTVVARQRAESLEVVDQQVARVLTALERTGEREETLVVFVSDNGYLLGEHGIREGKILPYEPALRVPVLMSGPEIPAGEVREDPVTLTDLAPTFVALADARRPVPADGRSVLRVARRGDRGWTRGLLTETGPESVVRGSDEAGDPLTDEAVGDDPRYLLGVRTREYLYTKRDSGFEELFDVSVDPRQYVNLVGDPAYAEQLTALRDQLRALRACGGKDCAVPLPAVLR
ncbi:sulfatase [Nocardioidaceae bacterium]|nr:sulfatase [Nocardioidaceae bacterium]